MALYEQINDSIAAVTSWAAGAGDTAAIDIAFLGLILSQTKPQDLDAEIDNMRDNSEWKALAAVKQFCELCGYSSPVVDDCVKDFLTGITFFVNYAVPETTTTPDYFQLGGSSCLLGYRWSRELQHETAKWDLLDCYAGLHEVYTQEGHAWYQADLDAGPPPTGDTLLGGVITRMYEVQQLANCFWSLYKCGAKAALTDMKALWTELQNHWSDAHYHYRSTDSGTDNYVWDALECVPALGVLEVLGESPANFTERILSHINLGCLSSYWESAHFVIEGGNAYHVVVHHNKDTDQRRTRGTFLVLTSMWQFWNRYTDTQKGYMRDMLQGTGGAHDTGFNSLLEAGHGLFDNATDRFKVDSTDGATSDLGTAIGSTLLFLMGIAPSTSTPSGSLAIPLRTLYLGSIEMVDPRSFRWDGANRKIRIPVFTGNLTFMYGASNVDYHFPRDGVYEVFFNEDYTSINKAIQISALPDGYYLDMPIISSDVWRPFQSSKLKTDVVWRRLTLTAERDGTTGWFKRNYVDYPIEAVISPKTGSAAAYMPGTYSAQTFTIYTPYCIGDGDQIVHNNRVYEVEAAQDVVMGETHHGYTADLKQLPLFSSED